MTDPKGQRYTKLDGLRGLLSIIVALNHSFLVIAIPAFADVWGQNVFQFTDWQSKFQQIFMILGNGGAAVTLFFIMSGFVLGLSFSKVTYSPVGLINYLIKRIIRLYPVYIFLVILTAIYMKTSFAYTIFPQASSWYSWWMNFSMTFKEFIYNLLFIHAYTGGVTWTLRVILIASVIFPIFYLISKKTSWWMDILITIFLVIISFNILNLPNFRDLRYLYMFYSGLSLIKFSEFFKMIPSWVIYLCLPFALFILMDVRYMTDEYYGGVIEMIISWNILGLLAFNEKAKLLNIFNTKVLKFFGRISYSLYLIHFSVLYLLARAMFVYLNLPFKQYYLLTHTLLFIISLVIATGVSIVVYNYIERPTLALSSKLQIPEKVQ